MVQHTLAEETQTTSEPHQAAAALVATVAEVPESSTSNVESPSIGEPSTPTLLEKPLPPTPKAKEPKKEIKTKSQKRDIQYLKNKPKTEDWKKRPRKRSQSITTQKKKPKNRDLPKKKLETPRPQHEWRTTRPEDRTQEEWLTLALGQRAEAHRRKRNHPNTLGPHTIVPHHTTTTSRRPRRSHEPVPMPYPPPEKSTVVQEYHPICEQHAVTEEHPVTRAFKKRSSAPLLPGSPGASISATQQMERSDVTGSTTSVTLSNRLVTKVSSRHHSSTGLPIESLSPPLQSNRTDDSTHRNTSPTSEKPILLTSVSAVTDLSSAQSLSMPPESRTLVGNTSDKLVSELSSHHSSVRVIDVSGKLQSSPESGISLNTGSGSLNRSCRQGLSQMLSISPILHTTLSGKESGSSYHSTPTLHELSTTPTSTTADNYSSNSNRQTFSLPESHQSLSSMYQTSFTDTKPFPASCLDQKESYETCLMQPSPRRGSQTHTTPVLQSVLASAQATPPDILSKLSSIQGSSSVTCHSSEKTTASSESPVVCSEQPCAPLHRRIRLLRNSSGKFHHGGSNTTGSSESPVVCPQQPCVPLHRRVRLLRDSAVLQKPREEESQQKLPIALHPTPKQLRLAAARRLSPRRMERQSSISIRVLWRCAVCRRQAAVEAGRVRWPLASPAPAMPGDEPWIPCPSCPSFTPTLTSPVPSVAPVVAHLSEGVIRHRVSAESIRSNRTRFANALRMLCCFFRPEPDDIDDYMAVTHLRKKVASAIN